MSIYSYIGIFFRRVKSNSCCYPMFKIVSCKSYSHNSQIETIACSDFRTIFTNLLLNSEWWCTFCFSIVHRSTQAPSSEYLVLAVKVRRAPSFLLSWQRSEDFSLKSMGESIAWTSLRLEQTPYSSNKATSCCISVPLFRAWATYFDEFQYL